MVISDGTKHLWLLGSVETGEVRYMYPLNASWFPEGWYSGTWKGSGGTGYTLTFGKDGQASINSQAFGKYIVSDNRIVITRNNGDKEVLYAAWNPDSDALVITFTTDDDLVAEVFTRESAKPSAPQPTIPTTPSASPQMPSEFPAMPDVQMPAPPSLNIDGVWGAYVNNQQWVVQYKGNQYFGWINGQPSEMGVVQIQGSTITGTNNQGVNFTAELELDPSGQVLTMTFPNGNTLRYQRLQ